MPGFCVKKLNVEFKKISDDQYSIRDLSEYDFNNIEELLTSNIEITIQTPSDEGFVVLMPCGRSQFISCKNKNILPLQDGQYCVSTKSCGAPIKKFVGYYPILKERLDGLIMTTLDRKYIHYWFNEFKTMQILDEYDNKKDAQRIYQDIHDMLGKCGIGQKCVSEVSGM